jgi:hypothetical protein
MRTFIAESLGLILVVAGSLAITFIGIAVFRNLGVW